MIKRRFSPLLFVISSSYNEKRHPIWMSFFVEVPCRIELQYPVLQTGASPLGQGTLSGCKGSAFYLPCKIFSLFFRILVIQSSQRQSKYLPLRQLATSSGMVMRVHQQFSLCEHSNVLLHSGQVFCIILEILCYIRPLSVVEGKGS